MAPASAAAVSSVPKLEAGLPMLNEQDAQLLASLADNGRLVPSCESSQQPAAASVPAETISHSSHPPSQPWHVKVENVPPELGIPGLDTAAFQSAVDLNEELVGGAAEWDDEMMDDPEDDPNLEVDDEDDQGPIQAYAKLEFPGFSYYIQTLDVSIGRRPGQLQQTPTQSRILGGMPQLPTPAGAGLFQAHITSQSKAQADVDVDLGPLKSISRLHARIFYYTGPIRPQGSLVQPTPARSSPMSSYRLHSPYSSFNPAQPESAATSEDLNQGTGQFVLSVVGRNGAFVDDVWVEKGGLVVLGKR